MVLIGLHCVLSLCGIWFGRVPLDYRPIEASSSSSEPANRLFGSGVVAEDVAVFHVSKEMRSATITEDEVPFFLIERFRRMAVYLLWSQFPVTYLAQSFAEIGISQFSDIKFAPHIECAGTLEYTRTAPEFIQPTERVKSSPSRDRRTS